jgi:hypothetical protein
MVRTATAAVAERLPAADAPKIAEVVESTVTFTSFAALGKARKPG